MDSGVSTESYSKYDRAVPRHEATRLTNRPPGRTKFSCQIKAGHDNFSNWVQTAAQQDQRQNSKPGRF